MAASDRHDPRALIEELLARPETFDFFQAVRVLELALGRPVGGDLPPEKECIRFRARPSLAFAATEIFDLQRKPGAEVYELGVACFGLVGPAGVLPQHYTELAIERLQLRDSTLRDFLDAFHHRPIALFHRAWTKSRLAFAYEHHTRTSEGEDSFTRALFALVGHGQPAFRRRRAIDDAFLPYASGHFSARRRTALCLRQLVSDVCAVPTRVEELVGGWLEIPTEERCVLRSQAAEPDRRTCLGRGATLGARVWDAQRKVRLVLGPLAFRAFEHLRPGGAGHDALCSVIEAYLGLEWSYELAFVLERRESPGITLRSREDAAGARLGRNAFLEAKPRAEALRRADFMRGQPRTVGT